MLKVVWLQDWPILTWGDSCPVCPPAREAPSLDGPAALCAPVGFRNLGEISKIPSFKGAAYSRAICFALRFVNLEQCS